QHRVRQLEIGLDELRLVTRLERVFHLLLPVTHTVRVEPEDLLHQVPRLRQIPQVLETRRRVVELLDPAIPFARLDQGLAERLVRLRIVRVVGDARLELFGGGRRRRGLDVREHQRGRRVSLVDHAVQAQVDERRLPRLRDRRVIFGLDESPRRRDVLGGERGGGGGGSISISWSSMGSSSTSSSGSSASAGTVGSSSAIGRTSSAVSSSRNDGTSPRPASSCTCPNSALVDSNPSSTVPP